MGKSCIFCGNTKGLLLLSDGFAEQSSFRTISDALFGCFNIQFLITHSEKDERICKKCIARLKYCFSFRKDVDRAHKTLYGHYFIENKCEIVMEAQCEDQYNSCEQYDNYQDDNREYIEPYNNDHDDYEIKAEYNSPNECASDLEDSPYSSDWSQDTDDILTHTGYNREVELINTKKKFEIPILKKDAKKCPVCGKSFPLHSTLVRHHTAHFPTHQCHVCGNVLSSSTSLNLHMMSHYGFSYRCDRCPKTFSNNITLGRHKKIAHLGIEKFLCSRCGQRLKNMKTKIKHMVEVHNIESSKYQCVYCKFRYITNTELRAHLKKEHFDIHTIRCDECSLLCLSQSELKVHNLKHVEDAEFKCKYCYKEFARKNNFKEHMKIHLEIKNYVCNFCGKAFVQKAALKSHLRTHN